MFVRVVIVHVLFFVFLLRTIYTIMGFPRGSDSKESACNAEDLGSTWVGKIPWRKAWQSTSVFLPGESHGQRSLENYSPWVAESDTTEYLSVSTAAYMPLYNIPQFLYPFTYHGHLGYYPFGIISDKASMDTCVQTFCEHVFVSLLSFLFYFSTWE